MKDGLGGRVVEVGVAALQKHDNELQREEQRHSFKGHVFTDKFKGARDQAW